VTVATPTRFEIESARERAELSDRISDEIAAAVADCGDGAIAYGKWCITDRKRQLQKQIIYCCRRPEFAGWKPDHNASDERLTIEDHPGYEFRGERLFPFRFQVGFSALTPYTPKSAEQLAQTRAARAFDEVQKLKASQRGLLFPEILDESIREWESRTK
jgi:hypothetical protein